MKRAQAGAAAPNAEAANAAPPHASIPQTIGEAVESVYWEAERLGITIEVEGLEDLPANADPSFTMKPDDLFTILLLAQRRHRHGQARADRAAGALRHG